MLDDHIHSHNVSHVVKGYKGIQTREDPENSKDNQTREEVQEWFECLKCSFNTNDKTRFSDHSRIHEIENVSFDGNECSFSTEWKSALMEQRHMIEQQLGIDKGGKDSLRNSTNKSFAKLEKVHPPPSKEKLDFLNSSETTLKERSLAIGGSREVLKSEMEVHTPTQEEEKEVFKCTECPFATFDNTIMTGHKLEHSTPEEKAYGYSESSYSTTSSKGTLLEQYRKQKALSLNIHKCKKCSFITSNKNFLTEHDLIHTSPKEESEFSECPFGTDSESSLADHSLLQDKQYGYFKCPDCTFSTFHAFSLKRHILQHEKHKLNQPKQTYQCEKCLFSTFHQFSLKRHILTQHEHKHSLPKQIFHCKDCLFSTSHQFSLRRHILNRHEPKQNLPKQTFQCNNCLFTTSHQFSLRRHILNVHKHKQNQAS